MQNFWAEFLQKFQTPLPPEAGNFSPDPQPPAAGSFALRSPMAPAAGGSTPRPFKSHTPVQISGYAPGKINICVLKITLTNFRDHGVRNLRMQLWSVM